MSFVKAETYRQYVDRLTDDLNLKWVGEGEFGTVIQHPTLKNIVAKVVRADSKYLKFCKFAKANRNNPWLPKIADIVKLNLDDSSAAYVVFLEKLRPLPCARWKQLRMDIGAEIDYEPSLDPRTWFPKPVWLHIAREARGTDLGVVAAYLAANYRDLDLHVGNLMLRGKQIVFTDPTS